jgi:hypothetical protein
MSNNFKTFLIEEPRISKIQNDLKIGVKDGPANCIIQKYRANNNDSTSTLFNIAVPSVNTLVDRHIMIECELTFQASFTVPVAVAPAAQAVTRVSAIPAAFPLNQALQSTSLTINNSKVSVQSSDILNILTKQYHQKYLSQNLQGCPNYVDKYFARASDAEAEKEKSGSYWSNASNAEKDSDTVGRGDSDSTILLFRPGSQVGENVMYTDVSTNGPGLHRLEFKFKVTEPLIGLPTCVLHENEGCYMGLSNLELVLQYGNLSNCCNICMSNEYPLLFTAGNTSTTTMTLMNDDGKFVCRYLSMHMSQVSKMNPRTLIPFDEYACYKTIGERLVSTDMNINSNVISMRQIPDLIFLCVRPQYRDQSPFISNNFNFPLSNLNITFNNVVGLLSDHSPQDLYLMSRRNGSYQTWNEFRGVVKAGATSRECLSLGPIIVIDPSRDLGLSDFLSSSSLGQFSFQCSVKAEGAHVDFCTKYELVVMASYPGVQVIEKGVSQSISGLLNMEAVLDAKKNGSSQVDYADVQKLAGGSMQKGKTMVGQILKKNNVSVSVNDKKVQPAVMANKLSNYM